MRNLIIVAAMAATALPMATAPADAQYRTRSETSREQRECQRELRRADSRREYRQERRECQREIRRAQIRDWRTYNRYDYNRYEPGVNAYYADQYYRDGRYYQERRLGYSDRVYRGSDGRYYCRRSDGTTGLIIGGAVGALLGNSIDNGRSSLLGTLIGGAAGAALGREIARSDNRRSRYDLRCR